jgi:glycosyltransferase involved in cell wall biosynthesis
LARTTKPVFTTLEPTVARVLQGIRPAPTFLPAGSNVPAMPTSGRAAGGLRVAVFSVTERNADEARLVASIVGEAATRNDDVSLVVFGRGAPEAEGVLRSVLRNVPLDVMGVIPALEVSRILASSDAMLFVRGEASSRRGTIVAAIANGLPIVAYRGPETGPSIEEAGVSLFERGDTSDAAACLVKIAGDRGYATKLRARQRDAYDRTFSWERLAETVVESL